MEPGRLHSVMRNILCWRPANALGRAVPRSILSPPVAVLVMGLGGDFFDGEEVGCCSYKIKKVSRGKGCVLGESHCHSSNIWFQVIPMAVGRSAHWHPPLEHSTDKKRYMGWWKVKAP